MNDNNIIKIKSYNRVPPMTYKSNTDRLVDLWSAIFLAVAALGMCGLVGSAVILHSNLGK